MLTQRGVRVRAPELSDAAALARTYDKGIEGRVATFETEPRTSAQLEATLRVRAGAYPTVVAEPDGSVSAEAETARTDEQAFRGGACASATTFLPCARRHPLAIRRCFVNGRSSLFA